MCPWACGFESRLPHHCSSATSVLFPLVRVQPAEPAEADPAGVAELHAFRLQQLPLEQGAQTLAAGADPALGVDDPLPRHCRAAGRPGYRPSDARQKPTMRGVQPPTIWAICP